MPLYLKPNLAIPGRAIDMETDYAPSKMEAFRAGVASGFEEGPWKTSSRAMTAEHFAEFPDMTDQDAVDFASAWQDAPRPGMAIADQQARIDEAGLTGKLTPNKVYDEETLDILIEARKEKATRDFIQERAKAGAAAAGIAGDIAGSMLDPLNIASMFVPILSEQRVTNLLGKAGSYGARMLTRAKAGIAEGAIGAAPLEAVTMGAKLLNQEDGGAYDSLMNIAGGAALGGLIRPLAGAVKEFRVRNDILKPWDVEASSELSRQVMGRHAKALAEARMIADPSLDARVAQREGYAQAAAYDLFIRQRSHMEKRPLEELYKEWQIDYSSGRLARTPVGEPHDAGSLETAIVTNSQGIRGEAEAYPVDLSGALELYEKQKVAISFFASAPGDKSQRDLIEVLRLQLKEAAENVDATPDTRKLWLDIEEAMQITPGAKWTAEQRERFADLALDAFWKGEVKGGLAPAFRVLNDQLAALYGEAAGAGVEMSGPVEKAFARMFHQDLAANDEAFRLALAKLLTHKEEDYISLLASSGRASQLILPHAAGGNAGAVPGGGASAGANVSQVNSVSQGGSGQGLPSATASGTALYRTSQGWLLSFQPPFKYNPGNILARATAKKAQASQPGASISGQGVAANAPNSSSIASTIAVTPQGQAYFLNNAQAQGVAGNVPNNSSIASTIAVDPQGNAQILQTPQGQSAQAVALNSPNNSSVASTLSPGQAGQGVAANALGNQAVAGQAEPLTHAEAVALFAHDNAFTKGTQISLVDDACQVVAAAKNPPDNAAFRPASAEKLRKVDGVLEGLAEGEGVSAGQFEELDKALSEAHSDQLAELEIMEGAGLDAETAAEIRMEMEEAIKAEAQELFEINALSDLAACTLGY